MGTGVSAFKPLSLQTEEIKRIAEANPNGEDVATLEEAKKALVHARQLVVRLSEAYNSAIQEKQLPMDIPKNDTSQMSKSISDFGKTGDAPSNVWLHHAESAKEALGPLALALDMNSSAIERAENIITDDVTSQTRAAYNATKFRQEKERIERNFQIAKSNLDEVRLDVAQRVGRNLLSDVLRYQTALDEIVAAEGTGYDQLEELAASIANTGPLERGQLCMVADHNDKMQKARVERTGADGRVTVSVWTVVTNLGLEYEEGYETSQKVTASYPRHKVYANGGKDRQTLNKSTVANILAAVDDPDRLKVFLENVKRPEFLMALYTDAAATRSRLVALGGEMEAKINHASTRKVEAMIPPLKGLLRATTKTMERYHGSYERLTDIARMTFVCEDVAATIKVLTSIYTHPSWTIIRFKNRLLRAHDAASTGGYRDMLMNVVDETSGHIAEIQITFRSFYAIKSHGGHAVYKLARLLELNEDNTTVFFGDINETAVKKIGAGLVRTINCTGFKIPEAVRDKLLGETGLLSPSCAVTSFSLGNVETLHSWKLSQLASPALLQHLGPNLVHLSLVNMSLSGHIPEEIGDCCINIEYLHVGNNPTLTGPIPTNWENLRKLKDVELWATDVNGPIPSSFFSGATELRKVAFQKTQLSGEIPDSIGRLTKLKILILGETQISGEIPASLFRCTDLEELSLNSTKMSGNLPDAIGQLTKLCKLRLDETQISGEIPANLCKCTDLELLNLAKTQMSGNLPESIGQLTKMKRLYLEDTNFSGELPKSLSNLKQIESICLHNTRIEKPKGADQRTRTYRRIRAKHMSQDLGSTV